MKICVTGHRPNKIYGYAYNAEWENLKNLFKFLLTEDGCTEAITGMALGVDTIFAKAVLELKKEGKDIKLVCAIPCYNQSKLWTSESKKEYLEILAQADEIHTVTPMDYQPWMMQKRNEYMVDRADKLYAVWDGSAGGTANCVNYANKKNKEINMIHPFE